MPSTSETQYEHLLVNLHQLIRMDLGDSPEADRIREEMEGPAQDLSSDSVRFFNQMSGDLYMLSTREHFEITPPELIDRAAWVAAFEKAFEVRDWNRLLALNRMNLHSGIAGRSTLAYTRSRAYERLGFYSAAAAFVMLGAELAPTDDDLRAYATYVLGFSKDDAKTLAFAADTLRTQTTLPKSIILASTALTRHIVTHPSDKSIVDLLTLALSRLPQAIHAEQTHRDRIPDVALQGIGALAALLQATGRTREAAEALNKIENIHPTSQLATAYKRQLLIERDRLNSSGQATSNLSDLTEKFIGQEITSERSWAIAA